MTKIGLLVLSLLDPSVFETPEWEWIRSFRVQPLGFKSTSTLTTVYGSSRTLTTVYGSSLGHKDRGGQLVFRTVGCGVSSHLWCLLDLEVRMSRHYFIRKWRGHPTPPPPNHSSILEVVLSCHYSEGDLTLVTSGVPLGL